MSYYVILPVLFVVFVILFVLFYRSGKKGIGGGFSGALPVLSKYSRDLTLQASQDKLDPVIGRQKEISRVIQVLSRRTKNNPVLIGKAGVGKTAIVEGLAEAIVGSKVPPTLAGKKVLSLDLSSILAGTKYRGEFENRLKKITDEIIAAKRSIILFIDEIHILAESGEAEGAINAADILKPMLARGELQVVGATTKDEYEENIRKDKTLDRRLQPVFVAEANAKQAKAILQGVSHVYEEYHQVEILPTAIDEAITSTNFIKSRAYPDKAIDALDEACSKARLDIVSRDGENSKTVPQISDKEIKAVVAQWKEGI